MTYSVEQVMEKLNCKKGTVEEFRKHLKQAGLIKPNASMRLEHIEMLRNALDSAKASNITLREAMVEKINTVSTKEEKIDLKSKILYYIESKISDVSDITLTTYTSDMNSYESFFLFELFIQSLAENFENLLGNKLDYRMYTFQLDGDTYRIVDTGNSFVYLFCKQKQKADTIINIEFIQTFIKPDTLLVKLKAKVK